MQEEITSGYAFGQLERALRRAVSDTDGATRARARKKVNRWQAVLAGMADGTLAIGSRTPVADTPAWVTLEVEHGGFATGRYLAETELADDEAAVVAALPPEAQGTTPRERLNLWYLTDAGQLELLAALADGTYRIDLPEDSALMVVAWLLIHDHNALALDIVAQLRPLMHRLRMTPRLVATPMPQGTAVRVTTVGEAKAALRAVQVGRQLGAMRETLGVWHPLYDRLVELWCDTVDGDLPHLSDNAVVGGWPCRTWPADWVERRAQWLDDYQVAVDRHAIVGQHPKSNFARLHSALLACERDSTALSGRDVGWIRRALANTVSKHGAPGSAPRVALRTIQQAVVSRPTFAALAEELAGRLDGFPDEGGLPSLDPVGSDMPAHLVAKAARALEAPVEELVARGVITSGEVLAKVLPQMTASLLAANLADADLATLYAQTYTAFRRRRSLLLLDLSHQVRFEELPWIGELAPLRSRKRTRPARQVLEQTTLLALTSFPHAILPNPLVSELQTLAKQAEVSVPLVEEVAADIFMGTFTIKWRSAAEITSRVMADTLYARYYDLPEVWATAKPRKRFGKSTAADFAALCVERAKEARTGGGQRNWVAENGTVLEQSQILTTHNLVVLVDELGLRRRITLLGPELADRAFAWAVRRQAMKTSDRHARLQAIKNCAYAWRQAIFFLSFADQTTQVAAVDRLRTLVIDAGLVNRLGLAVDGLAAVVGGARFREDGTVGGGRRFLGWTVGPHWALP